MPGKSNSPVPELKRLHEYQRALAAFSRVASEVLPTERLLHYVTAQVSRVTHIRHVKVMCYRPDKGDLLLVAGVGWKPGVVGNATFPLDNASPPGRSMQTAAPVIIEDLPNDPEFRMSPILREHGIVSALNVPVRIDGRTWGVLEVDADEPRAFDESDVTFLSTMANILGVALLRQETECKAAEAAAESCPGEVLCRGGPARVSASGEEQPPDHHLLSRAPAASCVHTRRPRPLRERHGAGSRHCPRAGPTVV